MVGAQRRPPGNEGKKRHPEGVPEATEIILRDRQNIYGIHLPRRPLITPEWRHTLHEYLGGTVHGLDGVPLAVGGIEDHVHLLIGLKPTHCVADFVRELKKASSTWAQSHQHLFAWQEGYSVFTVSTSQIEATKQYVTSQEEHHRRRDFREELMMLLSKHGVSFQLQYLE